MTFMSLDISGNFKAGKKSLSLASLSKKAIEDLFDTPGLPAGPWPPNVIES
jgi:hypothetical protein